jgi:predicted nuclease of predicted toxin-antitoxin system
MKLELDENIGSRGVRFLRAAGHDVATVLEQNPCSSPDIELISVCRKEQRCLVTLDLNFGNPLLFKPDE